MEFAALVWVIIIASSIWVLFDAKAIGARKVTGGGPLSMWPHEWFIACLLLWIVAFPIYLARRGPIKAESER
jgi:hypothetical protein